MRYAIVLMAGLVAPAQALTVNKETNPPTPVPLESPQPYHLPPAKQRVIARTRRTVEQHHDRAWAARQRHAIHGERGAVLREEAATPLP